MLKLAYGLSFAELYERDGLVRLDAAFLDHLGAAESALRPQLEAARATDNLDPKAESALIIEIAPHLDDFLAKLFGIEAEFRALAARHNELAPLYSAKTDPHNLLVHAQKNDRDGVVTYTIRPEHIRRRKGFALTDPGTDLVGALDQANYCIWCHTQSKDSCSKGLREKPPAETPGKVVFKKSPFGVTLAGCPLEEKISEFHTLKAQGNALSALAVIVIDNPMAAATGHRICNDCMKSCIFQKQEPVNIPQIETRTLKDVLELPWGFELYSLPTPWNPLNFPRRP